MKSILIINGEDMTSYYNSELLANLENCKDIRYGDTINFSTNTRFESPNNPKVMDAFNIYLRFLNTTVDRIIINL